MAKKTNALTTTKPVKTEKSVVVVSGSITSPKEVQHDVYCDALHYIGDMPATNEESKNMRLVALKALSTATGRI